MKFKKRIYTILSIVVLFVAGIAIVYPENTTAYAGSFCSSMGIGMDSKKSVNIDGMIHSDKGPRKWTVEELFKGSARFTSYYGEGEGGWLVAEKIDRGKGRTELWDDSTVQKNLEDLNIRNAMRCFTARTETVPGNVLLALSSGVTWITKTVMTGLIAGNIFGRGKNMINIVGVIGGSGGPDAGIIGTLKNSIYTPLVLLAFLIAAVNIIWEGLIKRQFRAALGNILWSVGAFILGVIFMYNPQAIAEAPQTITTGLADCLVAGLNGESCLSNQPSTSPSLLVGTECLSSIGGQKKGADMLTNGLTCGVWKTFVMEPWAQAQFGYSYKDLYTMNPPAGGSIWKGLKSDGEDFCVNLGSSEPASSFEGQTVILDQGPAVCNVALYQMYLSSDTHDVVAHKGDFPEPTDDYDIRWFDIITTMAKDDSNWYRWVGVYQGPVRVFAALTGFIGALASSSLLVVLGLMGLGYQIAGTLMIAFAPLFFLFAIVPGRGKKIFLGWLEVVVSSVLKYMATVLFVVVSLILYSAILANTTGITALIGVIVLTGTMFAYRSEVINIIGAANMGGKKLSNRFGKLGQKAGTLASATAGAAIGSKLAGGSLLEGASAGAQRQLKRGTSMTAQMFSQHTRTKNDMLRKEREKNDEKMKKEQYDNIMEEKLAAVSGLTEEDKEFIKEQRKLMEEKKKQNANKDDNSGGSSGSTSDVEFDVNDNRNRQGTASQAELDKIEKLKNMSNSELANLIDRGNKEEHTLAINEFNRRIEVEGDDVDEGISMNPHVNPALLSNKQLQNNIKKFRDDYYTEGTNFDSLRNNLVEYNNRHDLGDVEPVLSKVEQKRANIEAGVEPIPKRTTPTDKELKEKLAENDFNNKK